MATTYTTQTVYTTGGNTQTVYTTYPQQQQVVYTTQQPTYIVEDCHTHCHDSDNEAAAQCCLFAMIGCLCGLLLCR